MPAVQARIARAQMPESAELARRRARCHGYFIGAFIGESARSSRGVGPRASALLAQRRLDKASGRRRTRRLRLALGQTVTPSSAASGPFSIAPTIQCHHLDGSLASHGGKEHLFLFIVLAWHHPHILALVAPSYKSSSRRVGEACRCCLYKVDEASIHITC